MSFETDPEMMNDLQDMIEGDGPVQDAAAARIGFLSQGESRNGVTVVIPTIPPRRYMMASTVHSVLTQTRPVDAISIAVDHRHEGAAPTRNRALAGVRTEWTAFLDDDDTMNPNHIELLLAHAEKTGADVVYPWFDVPDGFDPFPVYEGQPFNEKALREVQNYIPVTVLVRTGLARGVGGFESRNSSTAGGASPCEEWGLWLKLLDIGARFSHLDQRTWKWNWHPGNTSGRGDRW
jgi:glycosyltransferase involved in cell wall biosynthesis